jgi:hypothetical protein
MWIREAHDEHKRQTIDADRDSRPAPRIDRIDLSTSTRTHRASENVLRQGPPDTARYHISKQCIKIFEFRIQHRVPSRPREDRIATRHHAAPQSHPPRTYLRSGQRGSQEREQSISLEKVQRQIQRKSSFCCKRQPGERRNVWPTCLLLALVRVNVHCQSLVHNIISI